MCGIAGVVSLDANGIPHMPQRLEVMGDLIAHRGPDGRGAWMTPDQRVGFAHRRLSIIDITETGDQPMSSASATIVHNGEIYNYLELRSELGLSRFQSKSDTETILLGYEKWGDSVVDHLRGMFAFALWDQRRSRLLLARDRFGIKPLYYYLSPENRLYFASEAKALLPFLPAIETDAEGLRDYLVFQQPLEHRTLFQHVRQLSPAHVLTVEEGRLSIRKYWEVYYERDFDHNNEFFTSRVEELIHDSVRIHTRADVPIGAYISGGIDSSLVATMAADHSDILGFTGYVDAGHSFDERKHALAVAESAGLELLEREIGPHHLESQMENIIYHLDYPVAGPGVVPQYIVSSLAAEHRKVVLGGQGGDELFGGYVRYLIAYFEQCIKGAITDTLDSGDFVVTYESIIPHLGVLKPYMPLLKEFFSDGLFQSMDRRYLRLVERGSRLGSELRIDLHEPYDPRETFLSLFNAENVERGSYFDSMTHADFKTLLPALLHVEDRVGMAFGLESRVPLLDHPLVEFAATIPADVKFKNGTLKKVLKEVAAERLPTSVMERRDKMGFPIPLVEWMRGPSNEWVRDVFATGMAKQRDYVDSGAIIETLDSEAGFGRTTWGYLCLELWQQRFHDRADEFRRLNPDAYGAADIVE